MDGGGRGVGVDDGEGGDSRPSGTMTREESTINKTPRISQLAGSYCCLAGRCCLLVPCCVSVAVFLTMIRIRLLSLIHI